MKIDELPYLLKENKDNFEAEILRNRQKKEAIELQLKAYELGIYCGIRKGRECYFSFSFWKEKLRNSKKWNCKFETLAHSMALHNAAGNAIQGRRCKRMEERGLLLLVT